MYKYFQIYLCNMNCFSYDIKISLIYCAMFQLNNITLLATPPTSPSFGNPYVERYCVVIFSGPQGSWSVHVCCSHLKMEFCSCARGRQWCGIIQYHWWTASIKPRLLFYRAGYASWGLSLSSVQSMETKCWGNERMIYTSHKAWL